MGKRFAIVIGVAAAGVMALGAQTATAAVEPVDGDLPEPTALQYKQKLGKAVKVKASCGDEACTVRAEGNLFWFTPGPPSGHKYRKLKPASAHLGSGETTTLKLKLTGNTRNRAREAFHEGKKVQAQVIVETTNVAGNPWPLEHNIKFRK